MTSTLAFVVYVICPLRVCCELCSVAPHSRTQAGRAGRGKRTLGKLASATGYSGSEETYHFCSPSQARSSHTASLRPRGSTTLPRASEAERLTHLESWVVVLPTVLGGEGKAADTCALGHWDIHGVTAWEGTSDQEEWRRTRRTWLPQSKVKLLSSGFRSFREGTEQVGWVESTSLRMWDERERHQRVPLRVRCACYLTPSQNTLRNLEAISGDKHWVEEQLLCVILSRLSA